MAAKANGGAATRVEDDVSLAKQSSVRFGVRPCCMNDCADASCRGVLHVSEARHGVPSSYSSSIDPTHPRKRREDDGAPKLLRAVRISDALHSDRESRVLRRLQGLRHKESLLALIPFVAYDPTEKERMTAELFNV